MRIEFEAAMAKQLSSEGCSDFSIEMMFERGSDDEYRSIRVNGAYWGWQASRESVVIDLPKQFKDADCRDLEELHEAIKESGVRTK